MCVAANLRTAGAPPDVHTWLSPADICAADVLNKGLNTVKQLSGVRQHWKIPGGGVVFTTRALKRGTIQQIGPNEINLLSVPRYSTR